MKMLPELAKWQEEYPPWLWAAASHELETQNKRETEEATWAPSFHLLSSGPRANSLLWAPCHAGLNPPAPWAEINKGCLCQVFLSQWQKEMNAGLETWLSQEGHLLYGHDNWCSNTHHPSTKHAWLHGPATAALQTQVDPECSLSAWAKQQGSC